MASAWGTSWLTSWGNSWGDTGGAPAPTPTPAPTERRKAMYPGGWVPDRLYAPPRRKISKRKLKALKELYEQAREVIPDALQVGLVPDSLLLRARPTNTLPGADSIDFDALARSLETIQVLIVAVQAAIAEEEKRKKRRREEETLIALLMEIL